MKNVSVFIDLETYINRKPIGGKQMLPKEFYPTPKELLDKVTADIDWKIIQTVLEPFAGKGDIADYIKEKYKCHTYHDSLDIDCIEIDENLRRILKRKGLRVVHDDFLIFKHYDRIIMNQ